MIASRARSSLLKTKHHMKRRIFIAIIALCIGASIVWSLYTTDEGVFFASQQPALHYVEVYAQENYTKTILQIPIKGLLLTESETEDIFSGLSGSYTDAKQVVRIIQEAEKNDSISGIVLSIDSPGGTVAAAHIISDAIASYRKNTRKPVISYVSGLGASGAYWVAAAADTIVAERGSMVGSVGVILGPFKYYKSVTEEGGILGGVVTKDGIETYAITAGDSKDVFSPYRKITDDELAHFQTLVDAEYQAFVAHVSARRKLSRVLVTSDIKALLYGAEAAVTKRLADVVGSYDDAYARAAPKSAYRVVESDMTGSLLDSMLRLSQQALSIRSASSREPMCSFCSLPLAYYGDVQALGR